MRRLHLQQAKTPMSKPGTRGKEARCRTRRRLDDDVEALASSITTILRQVGGPSGGRQWIETRALPAHRVGRLWKFKLSEVDKWVRAGNAVEKGEEPETKK